MSLLLRLLRGSAGAPAGGVGDALTAENGDRLTADNGDILIPG